MILWQLIIFHFGLFAFLFFPFSLGSTLLLFLFFLFIFSLLFYLFIIFFIFSLQSFFLINGPHFDLFAPHFALFFIILLFFFLLIFVRILSKWQQLWLFVAITLTKCEKLNFVCFSFFYFCIFLLIMPISFITILHFFWLINFSLTFPIILYSS